MLPSFARDTIVRVRYAERDDGHGNAVPDRANAEELEIPWCSGQPGATAELLLGRNATLIQHTIFAPSGSDILAGDSIRYRGRLFSIDGEPADWRSAAGALDHLVVLLKKWEG